MCVGIRDLILSPYFSRYINKNVYRDVFKDTVSKYKKLGTVYSTNSTDLIIYYIIRKIVGMFFKVMIEDLIKNNHTYRFPIYIFREPLELSISHHATESKKFKYNHESEGLTYVPIFVVTRKAYKEIGVQYYPLFSSSKKQMLNEEVKKGHRYGKPKYKHFTWVTGDKQ
jgi:hypothetical protein